MSYTGYSWHIV